MRQLVLFLFFCLVASFGYTQPSVYQEAVQLAQTGSPKEGLDLLKNALNADRQNPDLLYYTGIYLEQLKNITQAVSFYKKALKYDGTHFEANYRLGVLYEKADSIDVAYSHYQTALQKAPSTEKNNVLAKLIYVSNLKQIYSEEVKKYAQSYYESEKIEAMPAPVMLALATIFYQTSEYEKAKKLTGTVLDKTGGTSLSIQKAAFIYTSCAFRMQDFDAMSAHIGRIKDETLRKELDQTAPLYYYNLGYAYFFMYEYDKSLRYLRTALTIKADYVPAQVFLNQVEARKTDKSDFIDHIRQKIKLSEYKSHDAAYFADLTRLFIHEQRYNEAIKVADSCLMLEPNREELYFLKGIAYYKTIKDKQAIEVLQQGLKKFTRLDGETHAKYYLLLGLLYKRLKDFPAAKEALEKVQKGTFKDAAEWELSKLAEG